MANVSPGEPLFGVVFGGRFAKMWSFDETLKPVSQGPIP